MSRWWALALLFALPAQAAPPHLWATVRLVPFTGFPDLLGGSLTVHAIPYVDIEGGGSAFIWTRSAWVRAGPRYLLADGRRADHHGLTVRVAALFGFKWAETDDGRTRGFHFAGTIDFTYWLAAHLGLSIQLAGGGTFDPSRNSSPTTARRPMLPDIRLSIGLSF